MSQEMEGEKLLLDSLVIVLKIRIPFGTATENRIVKGKAAKRKRGVGVRWERIIRRKESENSWLA